jgi:cell division protease FtsH
MADYGKGFFEPSRLSDGMQKSVDEEIRLLIENAYQGALELLKAHREKLDTLAKVLVEKETIEEQEFEELMSA